MKIYINLFVLMLLLAGTNAYSLKCPLLTVASIKDNMSNPIMMIDSTPWNVSIITPYDTEGWTIMSIDPPKPAETSACEMKEVPSLCCFYAVTARDGTGKVRSGLKGPIYTPLKSNQ